jgi:hypothetical protein
VIPFGKQQVPIAVFEASPHLVRDLDSIKTRHISEGACDETGVADVLPTVSLRLDPGDQEIAQSHN